MHVPTHLLALHVDGPRFTTPLITQDYWEHLILHYKKIHIKIIYQDGFSSVWFKIIFLFSDISYDIAASMLSQVSRSLAGSDLHGG